ncbi:MAG: DNA primase [Ruminococcus sp.]|nr:DNA primase [Ruminococcus sp.]
MLSDVFLEQLRTVCPIETVMGSYVSLIRRGRTFVCNCPFHSEKTPSCTIYPEQQSFYCYGCGAGGDVITFMRRMENMTFMEAVETLAKRGGLTIPENKEEARRSKVRARTFEINRETANFYYRNLSGSNKTGLSYFAQRRLTPATIKKYGLGFAPDQWDALAVHLKKKGFSEEELITAGVCHRSKKGGVYDVFRNRVMFPIVDVRGNVIGFGGRVLDDSTPKYLNTSQTPVFDKGRNLFSLNFAKDSSSTVMILAEGYMDVIAINQAGFSNVVATLGTAITPDQARKISQYASEVIIAYDSDGAGQKATQKAIAHFNEVGLNTRILHLSDAKDPDEYIRKFGADRFRLLLEQSGDAIAFQMDRCKFGLELSRESDRGRWLNRLVEVLANVPNPLTRDVYISKAAAEADISPDVLRSQIELYSRREKNKQKKHNWDQLKQKTAPLQQRTPEGESLQHLERVEETLLGYLLLHPEKITDTAARLDTAQNTTEFFRRVFQLMVQMEQQNRACSLSALGEFLSTEEMARLSQVLARQRTFPPNEQTAEDCIRTLCNPVSLSVNSDDDLLRLVAQKKNRCTSE